MNNELTNLTRNDHQHRHSSVLPRDDHFGSFFFMGVNNETTGNRLSN